MLHERVGGFTSTSGGQPDRYTTTISPDELGSEHRAAMGCPRRAQLARSRAAARRVARGQLTEMPQTLGLSGPPPRVS
jgi:hypothetical protein